MFRPESCHTSTVRQSADRKRGGPSWAPGGSSTSCLAKMHCVKPSRAHFGAGLFWRSGTSKSHYKASSTILRASKSITSKTHSQPLKFRTGIFQTYFLLCLGICPCGVDASAGTSVKNPSGHVGYWDVEQFRFGHPLKKEKALSCK